MPRKIAGLLGITGLLGLFLLLIDASLKEYAPTHVDALVAFVIIDFLLATLVSFKPSKTMFTVVVTYSILRIILQLGDVALGPSLGFNSYADFANYLFNPLNMNVGGDNPPGIPGAVLDLMILLQIGTAYLAWKMRK